MARSLSLPCFITRSSSIANQHPVILRQVSCFASVSLSQATPVLDLLTLIYLVSPIGAESGLHLHIDCPDTSSTTTFDNGVESLDHDFAFSDPARAAHGPLPSTATTPREYLSPFTPRARRPRSTSNLSGTGSGTAESRRSIIGGLLHRVRSANSLR